VSGALSTDAPAPAAGEPPSGTPPASSGFDGRMAVGFLLSAALLVWALWGIDIAEVGRVLAAANLWLLGASAAMGTVVFLLRAARWQLILDPLDERVPIGPLWRATAVGGMVTNVIPARVGEVARAYALTRERPSIPFSAALASIAVDRVFDAIVIFLLTFLAMLDPAFPRGAEIGGRPATAILAGWGAAALAVLMVGLYAVALFPERWSAVAGRVAGRLSPRLGASAGGIVLAFARGLGVLKRPARFAGVLAWTIAHWLVNAFALWLAFVAVGGRAPATAMLFVQGLIAVGVALPAAPGFFGAFEKAGEIGLGVYGVGKAQAVTWAMGYHLLAFVPITVIGAVYAARLGLRLADLKGAKR
jgi:uncharacterized membrane protein YbhN (UPF0104 family)